MEFLDSNDVSVVSKYKLKATEFRKLPSRIIVTCPISLWEIQHRRTPSAVRFSIQICRSNRGTISSKDLPDARSSPTENALLEGPKVLLNLQIDFDPLYTVKWKNDNEIWTRGADKIMKLYNLHGELLESVTTKDGNNPWDIAITQDRELVYAYYKMAHWIFQGMEE